MLKVKTVNGLTVIRKRRWILRINSNAHTKKTRNQDDRVNCVKQQNKVNVLVQVAKNSYIHEKLNESVGKPGTFWKRIRESFPLKRNKHDKIVLLIDSVSADNAKTITSKFCKFFTNRISDQSKNYKVKILCMAPVICCKRGISWFFSVHSLWSLQNLILNNWEEEYIHLGWWSIPWQNW